MIDNMQMIQALKKASEEFAFGLINEEDPENVAIRMNLQYALTLALTEIAKLNKQLENSKPVF